MNRKRVITFLLMVLLIYTTSIYISFTDESSNSQKEKLPLKTANQFEYYELNGTLNDATSIQVELPDLTWNITEIQLNFTDISQHRQLRIIEENITEISFKPLYYEKMNDWIDYYGQHINFSEPTEVFGIYIYGFKTFITTEWVWVHMTGYEDADNSPDGFDVIHSQKINISNALGWYYQDFSSSSLIFDPDDYYIVLDGYDLGSLDPYYYFGCNAKNPIYPLLYEWERNDDGELTYQGQPFMCKILQKVNKTYFPEDLEMQGFIDQSYHDVLNGTQPGDGNLTLTNLNIKPNNVIFSIPTKVNESNLALIYNLSYYINLRKPVSVIIIEVGGGGNGSNSKVSTGIATEFFYFTIAAIIISFLTALFSYQRVKIIKRNKRRYREKIFNKYMDIVNLNYIMVSDKLSGLNIYEQMISGKSIDPTLISGFLQAISSFGIELTGSEEQSQTIKLEYQKSKILMSEFKNYRIINIFGDIPSNEFMDSLDPLSHDIDKYFGKLLKNFNGDTTKFVGIKELLERHLQIPLVYPLKVVIPDNNGKLKSEEKNLVNRALNFMKQKNSDYFYVSYLMSEGEFNPKRAENILGLIDRRIFRPAI